MRRRVGLVMFVAGLSTQASAQPGVADPWAEPPLVLPAPLEDRDPPAAPLRITPVAPSPPARLAPPAEPARSYVEIEPVRAAAAEPERPRRYPRSFVDRPVVLPRGVREFRLGGRLTSEEIPQPFEDATFRFGLMQLGAATGADGYELGFGVEILVLQDSTLPDGRDPELPVFQRLSTGVSFALSQDTFIGLSATIGDVFSETRHYTPSISLGHKFQPTERSAILVSGGIEYNRGTIFVDDFEVATHRVGASANVVARIQVQPLLALQASGSAAVYEYTGGEVVEDSYQLLSGGAALLLSPSASMDLVLSAFLQSADDVDVTGASLGVAFR